MTPPFTARRRAEELAAAVDSGSRTSGAHETEVARLVGVVTALRSHHGPTPRAEFTGDLRDRLMVEAEHVLTAESARLALPVRTRGPRDRRLVAAASAVVFIGGTAGMAAASHNALPGEALYPIKRGIERAEAGLSMSQAGKGRDLLSQATRRLDEVQGLLGKDSLESNPQVPQTLDEFSRQATEGAGLLLDSFQETRDPSLVSQVRTFAAEGIVVLERLAENVEPGAQDELAKAALALGDIDKQAAALCSTCATDLPALQIPNLIHARGEVDRALSLVPPTGLDNSHPVVVPEGTVRRQRDTPPVATSAGGQTPGSDPTVGSSAVPSTDGLKPDDLPTLEVPGTELSVSSEKEATGGLTGVVETLLPDPDSLLP